MQALATSPRIRLLTPTLSSFGEERENYFVGRFPGVAAVRQHRANFRSAFSAAETRPAIHFVSFVCFAVNSLARAARTSASLRLKIEISLRFADGYFLPHVCHFERRSICCR